jgi:hypothetical protein
MIPIAKDAIRALPKPPQPILLHPAAVPDVERATRPPLATPAASQALKTGDRVEVLGNRGNLAGEFGTVEQADEKDAVVKWDDDGRVKLRQPLLKKI